MRSAGGERSYSKDREYSTSFYVCLAVLDDEVMLNNMSMIQSLIEWPFAELNIYDFDTELNKSSLERYKCPVLTYTMVII